MKQLTSFFGSQKNSSHRPHAFTCARMRARTHSQLCQNALHVLADEQQTQDECTQVDHLSHDRAEMWLKQLTSIFTRGKSYIVAKKAFCAPSKLTSISMDVVKSLCFSLSLCFKSNYLQRFFFFPSLCLFVVAVMAILANCQDPVFLDENSTIPVTVPLGSPLILKCNLTRPTQIRNWVSWYFNSDEPSPTNPLKKVTNDTDLDKTMFRVTSNAKEKDSGWYFCNVTIDIPTLRTISSSGRKVVISKYYFLLANTCKQAHD